MNLLPIYSSKKINFFDLVSLIMTYGHEDIMIPYGLTGCRWINNKTKELLTSFTIVEPVKEVVDGKEVLIPISNQSWKDFIVIEGPKLDADGIVYFILWYKHEYDQRQSVLEAKKQRAEEIRNQLNSVKEKTEKAFDKMLKSNSIMKNNIEGAKAFFAMLVDLSENHGCVASRKTLTLYGYYEIAN